MIKINKYVKLTLNGFSEKVTKMLNNLTQKLYANVNINNKQYTYEINKLKITYK